MDSDCVILNYNNATTYCIVLGLADKKVNDFETDEDLIRYYGFKPSECAWMFTDKYPGVNFINKPLIF